MSEPKDKKTFKKGANKKYQDAVWSLLFMIIFLSFYFFYLLLRIKPELIYQAQEPVFFFDKYFINEFFSYPGGVNELISCLLSQFFYYSWTGALLLVLVWALIAWNTKLFIKFTRPKAPILYLHWLPTVILLALHSNYRFPLVLTLGVLWVLPGVNIYVRLAPCKSIQRFLFYIIIHALLYYITAGQVFIFSTIIIIYEVLYHRKIVLPLLYIIFAGLLPYIGASTLFVLHIQDAYLLHLTSYNTYRLTWLSWILYAFFPIVLLPMIFKKKYIKISQKLTNSLFGRLLLGRSVPMRLIQCVFFFFIVISAAKYSFNKNAKAFFLIDRYARFKEWEKVLDIAQKGLPISNIVQCQVNRALYHTGNLSDKMFSMTQLFGSDGLFMVENMRGYFALQHSDLFFDLGLINESEHWAYEAVTANGDTPWNLQRLILIYLTEEKREISEKYLTMLQKTIWHKDWARQYRTYLTDINDFWAHPQIRYLKSIMPQSDFLVSPGEPELCLEKLLENSKNKMAFEYFMAYCLLEGQVGRFVQHLHRLNYFNYPKIPRHFEEAILVYNQLTGGKGINLQVKDISEETIRKFDDFNRIMAKHNKNKKAARRELSKYRDTYWFYGLYYYQPKRQ
jgi:hypothetical protein